eukprot:TRINITY_DN27236_c0_g1_i1.p1 TRINITY_DN27236_c0_g1~~TRINITY_DN27236_c0_g1_i1.p1  ORF type:complete len:833 (-),score=117.21 TRINITY_DN27236_c0_g1_i1:63-2561(-)
MAEGDAAQVEAKLQKSRMEGAALRGNEIELGEVQASIPTNWNEAEALALNDHWNRAPAGLEGRGDDSAPVGDVLELETVALPPSAFGLLLLRASRRRSLLLPLLMVIPIQAAQIAVPCVIIFLYPEYLFTQGRWLVPLSNSKTMLFMKSVGLSLSAVQVADELHEIANAFLVLRKSSISRQSTSMLHWLICWTVTLAQYCTAAVVMIVASHLVLSREKPIDALWITYYVLLALNFDNMVVRFALLIWTMRSPPNFEFPLFPSSTNKDLGQSDFFERRQKVALIYVPLLLCLLLNCMCLGFDVLPITFLRYGFVSNKRPISMVTSSLGLKKGCCPISATWTAGKVTPQTPVNVSVPLLSFDAPEDGVLPEVNWVVWPSMKAMPTSLQIVEGQGDNGVQALLSGRELARPVQMFSWLCEHGYAHDVSKDIYSDLTSRTGHILLYHSKFPYAVDWVIPSFPWLQEAIVYAVARNPLTGALSPEPVSSKVLRASQCSEKCERCNSQGECQKCVEGYVQSDSDQNHCMPCAPNCKMCSRPGSCDERGCKRGFGHIERRCLQCASRSCESCDANATEMAVVEKLPCMKCRAGHGMDGNGTCKLCTVPQCSVCGQPQDCQKCDTGFTPVQDSSGRWSCGSCASHCISCDEAGVDRCDVCQDSFVLYGGQCQACGKHCLRCEKASYCSAGGCVEGYGLQGSQMGFFPSPQCRQCSVANCKKCDSSGDTCDECGDEYGLTSLSECAPCGPGCVSCDDAGSCTQCVVGFVAREGKCKACADDCLHCAEAGPSLCDNASCATGWTAVPEKTAGGLICRPCSDPDCPSCDRGGPGTCDTELRTG